MRDLTAVPAEAGPVPARALDYIRVDAPQPVVLAYGIGVDSTALLLELESRGTPPDLVITGDPGVEKPETYAYQKMIAAWMAARGIPYVTVRYTPRRFKHWPPYFDLLSNVLTNATLPSISLGRHSCSLKWKVAPPDAFLKQCEPAKDAWARGQKVVRRSEVHTYELQSLMRISYAVFCLNKTIMHTYHPQCTIMTHSPDHF